MKNKKNKPAKRHASLKSVNGRSSTVNSRLLKAGILIFLAFAVCALICYLTVKIYNKGISIRNSQSIVTDQATQIEIKASPHFPEANVRALFNLTNGCNLAEIDFNKRRQEALRKYPLFSNIKITKRLPDKVTIAVEERKPIARINFEKDSSGRVKWLVVDSEGVVFNFPLRDSTSLPIIKESKNSANKGQKVSGKAQMALRLIELCSSKDIANIHLTEVDVSNDIYLVARTREYNKIELMWDYICKKGVHDAGNMDDAIRKISSIISAELKTGHYQTFIVTDRDRVTVSPNEKEFIR
jgi:cell division septal protein FtsQ